MVKRRKRFWLYWLVLAVENGMSILLSYVHTTRAYKSPSCLFLCSSPPSYLAMVILLLVLCVSSCESLLHILRLAPLLKP